MMLLIQARLNGINAPSAVETSASNTSLPAQVVITVTPAAGVTTASNSVNPDTTATTLGAAAGFPDTRDKDEIKTAPSFSSIVLQAHPQARRPSFAQGTGHTRQKSRTPSMGAVPLPLAEPQAGDDPNVNGDGAGDAR